MIAWRTSRFLLVFFVLKASIVGVAVITVINQRQPNFWHEPIVSLREIGQDEDTADGSMPDPVAGQAAELPRYPAVQIKKPSVSIFEAAS